MQGPISLIGKGEIIVTEPFAILYTDGSNLSEIKE